MALDKKTWIAVEDARSDLSILLRLDAIVDISDYRNAKGQRHAFLTLIDGRKIETMHSFLELTEEIGYDWVKAGPQ